MENEIALRVEDSIATIRGLKHIHTAIRDSVLTMAVEFRLEKSANEAQDDVRAAIARVRSDLPDAMQDPIVDRIELSSRPLLFFAVESDTLDDVALSWLVDHELSRALMKVRGVGSISRVGGVDRQINVDIDHTRAAALGITAAEVSRALRNVQLESAGGKVELGTMQQPVYQQQNYQQPYGQQGYQQPYRQSSLQNAGLPMNWHKFLVYFGLWAGAAFNLLSAILTLTGAQYGEYSELVYAFIPGLKIADVVYGIVLIGIAVLGFITAFQLLKLKRGAPKLLTLLFILSAVASLLYVAAEVIILLNYGADLSDMVSTMATTLSSLGISVFMIIANSIYYKKRAHLFVN